MPRLSVIDEIEVAPSAAPDQNEADGLHDDEGSLMRMDPTLARTRYRVEPRAVRRLEALPGSLR